MHSMRTIYRSGGSENSVHFVRTGGPIDAGYQHRGNFADSPGAPDRRSWVSRRSNIGITVTYMRYPCSKQFVLRPCDI